MKSTTIVATAALLSAAAAPAVLSATLPPRLEDVLPAAKRNPGVSLSLPLTHHRRNEPRSYQDVQDFADRQKAIMESKFGQHKSQKAKRQIVGLTDVATDSFYLAQLSVGTPAQNFDIVLDTGSADFWIADTDCTQGACANGIPLYDATTSTTHVSSNTPFDIQYGGGSIDGTLFADTVSLAGYTVYNTTAAEVGTVASGVVSAPASGLMGMAFQTLATSGATPFWEVLAKSNVLQTPAFTFQLARNALTATSATDTNPGGVFTLGEIDTNQYTGDITYVDLPTTTEGEEGYWAIPVDSVAINGQTTTLSGQLAAIDTGTTLIGAPSDVVDQIYSSISGAVPVTSGGSSSGYYAFPCSTTITAAFSFGGRSFTMATSDFNAGQVSGSLCLGSIFTVDLGTGGPDWIMGDAFLKNVFSVFESEPSRVGFADLVNGAAQTVATTTGAVAAATGSSNAAATTAGSSPPSVTANSAAADATGIVGGSGLPNPVAANAIATGGSTVSTK